MYKPQPVGSIKNLKERVERLFRESPKSSNRSDKRSLDLFPIDGENEIDYPGKSIANFLDFITDAMPDGDVYLFGGVIRDLALLGRKGFDSDIDLVVEGDWTGFVVYLESLNAYKNKFGGYRLSVGGWPVDIWNARETWAIKEGLVPYKGIASLTETTVLNWDAILMNWRTRGFIYRNNYFEEMKLRVLDIVLEENPNPLGMAVRVFRHALLKEAKKVTPKAMSYLVNCAKKYSFEELRDAELKSYRNSVIDRLSFSFFENIDASDNADILHEISVATDHFNQELKLVSN